MPRRLVLAFLALVLLAAPAAAQDHGAQPAKAAGAAAAAPASGAEQLPADKVVTTDHVVQVDGKPLAYSATAGSLPVGEGGDPQARLFYVAYRLKDAVPGSRPVTFAFNGGPGAAALYLQLGAMGPRRIVLNPDGTIAAAQPRLADNPETWLAFTDLVFVDPVGTGFSRSAKEDDRSYFGTRKDLDTLARFIRLYLTRNDLWLAPKYLVGESYGGFRVAALSRMLPSDYGIRLNGAIMLSPVLEFALIDDDSYALLPWALRLPSYAAVAAERGRSALPAAAGGDPRTALGEVESFALGDYLEGLAQGEALPPSRATQLWDRVARYAGLPADAVARDFGRVPAREFVKALLRDRGRVLSLYDGSFDVADANPQSPVARGGDALLMLVTAELSATFNAYVRDELKFDTDLPYEPLSHEVSRRWEWQASGTDQGYLGAGDDLKQALTVSPGFRVMIAHGLYDLVTPYATSAYVVRQMYLDPAARARVTLTTYAAGHMVYTHDEARIAFWRDAAAFYRATP
jgi:carboxypeptidase C (cathepsin A)